ncbi:DUF4307 domain-containing protein [Isoptericola sp. S6320L]|uniref:DUF4307 domain-containing protein n=1 Tax=Isoptericola sp. S6320L TaxID=2926411 RepID=UPI001FF41404|nr:DUF4307 domain-containing protein [Isoptericola sp. S6320L]MCK0117843.1 DUF4307 domain-containing protein [Isoptericola sp. S6320L]
MTSEQSPTVPPGRYGDSPTTPATARRGPGRGAKVAIGVALAAAVGATAWFSFARTAADPVTAEMVGFEVVDAEHLDVTFQVHMPPGTTAVCTVDALSTSYAQVGTLEVPVGPVQDRTSAYTVTVGTSEEATAADVTACAPTGD